MEKILIATSFLVLFYILFLILRRPRLSNKNVDLKSPIEKSFWTSYVNGPYRNRMNLEPNYRIVGTGKVGYIGDFVDLKNKIVIELDGYRWHKGEDNFIADRKREREIESKGYRLIRFAGKEVYHNPDGCVKETYEYIKAVKKWRGTLINILIWRKPNDN